MSEAPLLQQASSPRVGTRHILIVLLIAVSQASGAQIAAVVVHAHSAAFLIWFGTAWNMLLFLPLFSDSHMRNTLCRPASETFKWWAKTALQVVPFYLLWTAANILYVHALAGIAPATVSAIFSITPALVALLSVPLLNRQLTLLAALACVAAAGGVVLIAEPWQTTSSSTATTMASEAGASPPPPPHPLPVSTSAAILSVLVASACAALYKVLFRRWHGDAPTNTVLLVLACIGLWSVALGTPLMLVLDPSSFEGDRAHAVSASDMSPVLVWTLVCARAVTDLTFNYSIAYGITLIHPLFIAIGTLLATPLNVLATFVLHRVVPKSAEWGGILLVLVGFGLLLADERCHVEASAQDGHTVEERRSSAAHEGDTGDAGAGQGERDDDTAGASPAKRAPTQ